MRLSFTYFSSFSSTTSLPLLILSDKETAAAVDWGPGGGGPGSARPDEGAVCIEGAPGADGGGLGGGRVPDEAEGALGGVEANV